MLHYPDAPGHGEVDTSTASADALMQKLFRLQHLAPTAFEQAGWIGLTADELADQLGLDRAALQPPSTELARRGLIKDSGQRRYNGAGKQASVGPWRE